MSKWTNTIRSESGAAQLVMVMVAAAIGGAVMLSNVAMFAELGKSNRNVSQVVAAGAVQKGIEGLIKEIPNCSANFQGKLLDGATHTEDLVDSAGTVILDVDSDTPYENSLVRLRNYTLTQEAIIRTSPNYEVLVRLNLFMEKTGQTIGGESILKTAKLVAVLSGAGGTIQSCYGVFGGENILWSRSDDKIFQTDLTNRVGIGTTEPAELFSVGGGTGHFRVGSEGDVTVSGGADNHFGLFSTSGDLRMSIEPSGVVGYPGQVAIGTTTPRNSRAKMTVENGNLEIAPAGLTSYPPSWGNGLHTWDVYGEGTIASGKNGNVSTYMNSSGDGFFARSVGVRTAANPNYSIDVAGKTRSTEFCIGGSCRTTFEDQGCPAEQVPVRIRADGTVECGSVSERIGDNLNCPANTYFAGMEGNSPICRSLPTGSCPASQYIDTIAANGTITCKPIPPEVGVPSCPPGQFITAISAGIPSCATPPGNVANHTCSAGMVVTSFDASGTPQCSGITAGCPENQALTGFSNGTPQCREVAGWTTPPAEPMSCTPTYRIFDDARTSAWGAHLVSENDTSCSGSPCGMQMGLTCTGGTGVQVRLVYQFEMMSMQGPEVATSWASPLNGIQYGGNSSIRVPGHDKHWECGEGRYCGVRILAETTDPAVTCNVNYTWRAEHMTTSGANGSWARLTGSGFDDDSCQQHGGCGITMTLSCY